MEESAGPVSRHERVAAATRQAILDAFLSLAHDSNAVTVSIPAVAERAGVSIRTVYRYFPSKDDLQNAAAYHFTDQALGSDERLATTTVDTIDETLADMWTLFADRLPALLAEHTTPAGRRLRAKRLEDSRTLMRRQAPVELTDDQVDMLVAVTSSSMFLELCDRMGHGPEHAAGLAARLGRLVIAEANGSALIDQDTLGKADT